MPKKTIIKHTDNECCLKIRHETKKEAQSKADGMEGRDGRPRSVYNCKVCSGWHTATREGVGVRR